MEYLLTFPNTHYAVQAEQVLLTRKVAVRVFTLPPSLTDGCGIGLLINEADCMFFRRSKSTRSLYFFCEK